MKFSISFTLLEAVKKLAGGGGIPRSLSWPGSLFARISGQIHTHHPWWRWKPEGPPFDSCWHWEEDIIYEVNFVCERVMNSALAIDFLERWALDRLLKVGDFKPVDLPCHWLMSRTEGVQAQSLETSRFLQYVCMRVGHPILRFVFFSF